MGRPVSEGALPEWLVWLRPLYFQFTARDGDDVAEWLRAVFGVVLSPAQQYVVDRAWATLRDKQKADEQGGPGMSHSANESDQFTPMNTNGQTAGLPTADRYPHREVGDQAPLVNPSAGTQGAPGGGVNPMGAAPVPGTAGPPTSGRQVAE